MADRAPNASPRRHLSRALCAAVIVIALTPASPAHSASFASPAAIPIADGTGAPPHTRGLASPYPSSITVSEFSATVSRVTVTLRDITHPNPDDLDMMLVGPRGQNVVLLSDAGAELRRSTTSRSRSTMPRRAGPRTRRPWARRPTSQPTILAGSAKRRSTSSRRRRRRSRAALTVASRCRRFRGTNPNGRWTLYVTDDRPGGTGSVASGWALDITTPTSSPLTPPRTLPPPVLGRNVNVERVSGRVLLSLPSAAPRVAPRCRGSRAGASSRSTLRVRSRSARSSTPVAGRSA